MNTFMKIYRFIVAAFCLALPLTALADSDDCDGLLTEGLQSRFTAEALEHLGSLGLQEDGHWTIYLSANDIEIYGMTFKEMREELYEIEKLVFQKGGRILFLGEAFYDKKTQLGVVSIKASAKDLARILRDHVLVRQIGLYTGPEPLGYVAVAELTLDIDNYSYVTPLEARQRKRERQRQAQRRSENPNGPDGAAVAQEYLELVFTRLNLATAENQSGRMIIGQNQYMSFPTNQQIQYLINLYFQTLDPNFFSTSGKSASERIHLGVEDALLPYEQAKAVNNLIAMLVEAYYPGYPEQIRGFESDPSVVFNLVGGMIVEAGEELLRKYGDD